MTYTVQYQTQALSDLKKLDKQTQKRIINKVNWLAVNFEQITPLPLSENWAGFYKLRVGDYRVIYSLEQTLSILWIEKIGHRRDIYET
ncbi:MAG: type II toxin-antitoxin system RelE/ParE family toxin [Prochlorothrix sp.]|nr:type II toxin-antitoxin system RelE/ParE family toxin [Prochlorothrix sp.]